MTIQYREPKQLFIWQGVYDHEKFTEFFLAHRYDNIYVENEEGLLIGVLSQKEWKRYLFQKPFSITPQITIESDLPHHSAYDVFEVNKGLYRLPVAREGRLVAEYMDTNYEGADYECLLHESALKWLPIFQNEIKAYLKSQHIEAFHICGSEKQVAFIKEYLNEFVSESAPITLDVKYPKKFRQYYFPDEQNVFPFYDILATTLVQEVIKYVREKGIMLITVNGPTKKGLSTLYEDEQQALTHAQNMAYVLQNTDYVRKVFSDEESFHYVMEDMLTKTKIISNGIHEILLDQYSEGLNIINGMRITTNQPEHYKRDIHVYGPCVAQGLCVTDEYTIESYLQRYINDVMPNAYRVLNHGIGDGGNIVNDCLYILNTPLRSGDIVVIINDFPEELKQLLLSQYVPLITSDDLLTKQHYWFLNHPFHCNKTANEQIANALLEQVRHVHSNEMENNQPMRYFEQYHCEVVENPDVLLENNQLLTYIEELKLYRYDGDGRIGAIVMNASPFTLGHYYLIEQSAKTVDYVYVFVIEENRSAIPFLDRIKMVKHGTKHLQNVCVLSSGSIMASELTFSAYFHRSNQYAQEARVDPTMHLKVFAELVCPVLRITTRIFGTEPTDEITEQLNKQAMEMLPAYGIEVLEFPRNKVDEKPISASIVRKLVAENDFETLKQYVPSSTYRYYEQLKNECEK